MAPWSKEMIREKHLFGKTGELAIGVGKDGSKGIMFTARETQVFNGVSIYPFAFEIVQYIVLYLVQNKCEDNSNKTPYLLKHQNRSSH